MSQDSEGMSVEEQIKNSISDDVLASASSAGVEIDDVIDTVVEKYADYSPVTQARFASAELNMAIEAESADEIRGIAMGARDRYGKNWPRRVSLLRSDGEHIEVSHWDSRLPGPNNADIKVPHGSVVSVGCKYEEEYDSYQAKRITSVNEIDHETLLSNLEEVAIPPREIGRTHEHEVVCIRGEIAFVNAQTLFKDGERAGDGPVLMENEAGDLLPHFEISLVDDDRTRVRGHLERQAHAERILRVPDLELLLKDASQRGDPESQASFLDAAMKGMDVIMVGNVGTVNESRNNQGELYTYVDIGVTGLIALESTADAAQTSLADLEEGDDDEEDDEEDEAEEADEGEPRSDLIDGIKAYAEAVGADPADLDPEVMAESAADDVTVDEVRAAIARITHEAEEGGETAASDEGDGEPLDMLLGPDGAYACPVSGCAYGSSVRGSIAGHIQGEHDGDPFDESWISEHLEG